MLDLNFLSLEAKRIHDIFQGSFYVIITTFVLISIVLDYFKLPLGGSMQFAPLISRIFIAVIMLLSFKEFQNTLGDVIDALTKEITDINQVNTVLKELSLKLHEFSWHNVWPFAKDSILALISFISIACMYYSVFICNGILLFTWTLLYVLSPILIAFFIFPQTSQVTKNLFSSLIQVSLWKIMWAILVALLWSTAFSNINKSDYHISYPSVIAFNLILASTIFKTPQIIGLLAGPGIAAFMSSFDKLNVGPVEVSPASTGKALLFAGAGYAAGAASHAASSTVRAGRIAVARHREMKTPGADRTAVDKQLQKIYPARPFKKAKIPFNPIR
jgi:hypothetical protein